MKDILLKDRGGSLASRADINQKNVKNFQRA